MIYQSVRWRLCKKLCDVSFTFKISLKWSLFNAILNAENQVVIIVYTTRTARALFEEFSTGPPSPLRPSRMLSLSSTALVLDPKKFTDETPVVYAAVWLDGQGLAGWY